MDKTLKETIRRPEPDKEVMIYDTQDCQSKETGKVRKRRFFAWYPIWLAYEVLIPLRGCQFTWWKWVEVEEKQKLNRYSKFDDGWSYDFYWGEWKERWITIAIRVLKNRKDN